MAIVAKHKCIKFANNNCCCSRQRGGGPLLNLVKLEGGGQWEKDGYICFKNGPFPASFSLFSSFQYSWQWIFNIKFCWWLDSNRGPLESEATALPTEPQPLRQCFNVLVAKFLSDYLLLARIKVWWKRWTNNLGAKMSRRDKSSKSSVTDLGGGWDHPRTKSEKKKARNFLYGKSFQLATESFRIFFIKIAVVAELLQKSLLTPEIRGSIPVISCLYLLSTE